METDKLLKKVETFLEGYEDKSDVRIKAADYLKGIDMLYKVTVESNKEKLSSNIKVTIDFNLLGDDVDEQNDSTNQIDDIEEVDDGDSN